MNVNVKPDAALKKKLAAGTLTIPDRVLLALAEAAAGLLPEAALRQGDAVTVTHRGQTFTCVAGPPLRGALSLAVTLESVVVS